MICQTILSVADVDSVTNFLSFLFGIESKQFSDIKFPHSVLTFENSHSVYIIDDKYLSLQMTPNRQLFLEGECISEICARAVQKNGAIIEESVVNGQRFVVICGPSEFRLCLMDKAGLEIPLILQCLYNVQTSHLSKESNLLVDSEWCVPKGHSIPTLYTYIKHLNSYRPIDPNSRPIKFKSDLFDGVCALYIRTSPLDKDYKHIFQSNTATFEVQVQGKFTKIPRGKLYIGAEITKQMKLGMITKSICGSLLNFARTSLKNPYLHHSFGDSQDRELPHITASLWSTADKILITPPNATPPQMGLPFEEDPIIRKQRRSNPLFEPDSIDLNSTYSFSTKAQNIEVCDWILSGIPLMNTLDLHTFWSDADLRLCCYAVAESDPSSLHLQETNEYCFSLDLKHISNHPEMQLNDGTTDPVSGIRNFSETVPITPSESRVAQSYSNITNIYADEDEELFYDADEGIGKLTILEKKERDESEIKLWSSIPICRPLEVSNSINSGVKACTEIFEYVPYVIQINPTNYKINKRDLYIIQIPINEVISLALTELKRQQYSSLNTVVGKNISKYLTSTKGSKITGLISFMEFQASFSTSSEITKQKNFDRMSKSEQRRMILNDVVSKLFETAQSIEAIRTRLILLLLSNPHADEVFSLINIESSLNSKIWGAIKFRSLETVIIEGLILIRVGQTHWEEGYLLFCATDLIMIRSNLTNLGRSNNSLRISRNDVLNIQKVDNNYLSFLNKTDYKYYLISTFAREYLICVREKEGLWDSAFISFKPNVSISSERSASVDQLSNRLELVSHPPDWNLGDRIILNGRSFFGRLKCEERKFEFQISNPMHHVASTLDILFQLCDQEYQTSSNPTINGAIESMWLQFLENVSLLTCINLQDFNLSEKDKICLFVNLYHIMILHSYLILGTPSSILKWPSFFNSCSYEAFGDIFSLAELDHCIVKAGIGKPNSFFVQALVPQSVYDIGVYSKDFRILWALNCGSLTCPATVPIFKSELLDKQLDFIMNDCAILQISLSFPGRGAERTKSFKSQISDGPILINFSQICQWYVSTIVPDGRSSSLIRKMSDFCRGDIKDILNEIVDSKEASYSLKYTSFDFRCRLFRKNDSI